MIYVNELTSLVDNMRESTEIENQMIRENRYNLASDPTETFVQPKAKDAVPYLNFSNLLNAITTLEKSANAYRDSQKANPDPNTNLEKLNALLFPAEQKLLVDAGLPRRPWFRHTIYAPGYYTGYGVKTLPGIREAIEQRNWQEAQQQIDIVAANVIRYASQIDEASAILKTR